MTSPPSWNSRTQSSIFKAPFSCHTSVLSKIIFGGEDGINIQRNGSQNGKVILIQGRGFHKAQEGGPGLWNATCLLLEFPPRPQFQQPFPVDPSTKADRVVVCWYHSEYGHQFQCAIEWLGVFYTLKCGHAPVRVITCHRGNLSQPHWPGSLPLLLTPRPLPSGSHALFSFSTSSFLFCLFRFLDST